MKGTFQNVLSNKIIKDDPGIDEGYVTNTSTIRHVPSTLKKEMRKPEDHSFCYRVDQFRLQNGQWKNCIEQKLKRQSRNRNTNRKRGKKMTVFFINK